MKASAFLVLLSELALAAPPATPPPKVVRVVGECQGGNRPSVGCKTCEHCAYCSPRRHPGGVCAVCARWKSFPVSAVPSPVSLK